MWKLYLLYFKRLSIKRTVNFLLLTVSYLFSLVVKKPIVYGKPSAISVEVSSVCNLKCPECLQGMGLIKRKQPFMSFSVYQKALMELSDSLIEVQLFFQGEPFMNKKLMQFIAFASQKGMFTTVSTNAQLFNSNTGTELLKSGLDKLIISMDGMQQETYQKYRKNGDLSKVFSAIDVLLNEREKMKSAKPFVELQFLVFSHNEHEIEALKSYYKKTKLDALSLKTAQIYSVDTKVDLLPTSRYSRYKISGNRVFTKKRIKNRCKRLWYNAVLSSDADLYPCCFDKLGAYKFGNVKNADFLSVWKGEKAKAFRYKVLNSRKEISICTNCSS